MKKLRYFLNSFEIYIKKYFLFYAFLLQALITVPLLSRTSSAKTVNIINNFNESSVRVENDKSIRPILRVESDSKNTLTDLYTNFYYTNSATPHASFRHFYPGNSSLGTLNGENFAVSLQKQATFSIGDKYDWGYYLDNGLFGVYFKDELLPDRGYLKRRFGAKGFIFISDTLADKLLEVYNIQEKGVEGYKKLITDESYSILRLSLDNEQTESTFSINNIIYSNCRTAPRVLNLYGDFALPYGDNITMNQIKYCAEFDLKNDIFGTKKLLKLINEVGYDFKDSNFSFYSYNPNNNGYDLKTDIAIELANTNNKIDPLFYSISIIICLCYSFLCIYFNKKLLGCWLHYLIFGVLFSIILALTFFAPITLIGVAISSLSTLVGFIIVIPIRRKEHFYEFSI